MRNVMRIAGGAFMLPLVWLSPVAGQPEGPVGGGMEVVREIGFQPLNRVFERPYRNEHCLRNCHGLPEFGAGGEGGVLRSLHVDEEAFRASTHGRKGVECVDCHADADPNWHPRSGFREVDCRACHARTPPPEVHPPDALLHLSEKGIQPPPKESLVGDPWGQTVHGREYEAGNPAAPFCSHCHGAHSVRRSSDPAAPTHRDNLPRTCGNCHVDQVRSYDVGGALARFRIAAHGKGDLSARYSKDQCLSCHSSQGAHGEENLTGHACPTCHRVPEKREAAEYASLHIRPLAADQPLAGMLRWVYRVGFWSVLGALGLVAVVAGFVYLYRERPGGETTAGEDR